MHEWKFEIFKVTVKSGRPGWLGVNFCARKHQVDSTDFIVLYVM